VEAQIAAKELARTGLVASADVSATLPALRVRALGEFSVWRGGVPLDASAFRQRTPTRLFKLLLCAPALQTPRERLAEALWPGADARPSDHRLRSAVWRLRRFLDPPGTPPERGYLRSIGELIRLAPSGDGALPADWLDAHAFASAARRALDDVDLAASRAALALYTGEYLPEEPYWDGAEGERQRLRRIYESLVLHAAQLARLDGDLVAAEMLLRDLLAGRPDHEEAAAALMRLLAGERRQAAALRVYDEVTAALRAELGVGPGPQLASICTQIRGNPSTADTPASMRPTADKLRMRSTLPIPLAGLIGREQDLAALRELLPGTRLLTIAGMGGVGKTRLAVELGRQARSAFGDGVYFVDLSSLTEPALVPRAVNRALGVINEPGRDPMAALVDAVADHPRSLLMLDNAEHQLSAVGEVAGTLLSAVSEVTILITSRAPLAWPGETVWRLAGLTVPAAEDAASVQASEAARLLLARARAVRADFTITEENAPSIAGLCRELDGVPLAIELAAARLTLLTPAEILQRLTDRFTLLVDARSARHPRQRALRATMDWSHGLLDEAEQAVLRRLSIFADGCTLEAAETICAGEPVPANGVLAALHGLAQNSLIQSETRDDRTRYQLLETVRAYASEKLVLCAEAQPVARAHAHYYLALAEETQPGPPGDIHPPDAPTRLDVELQNFRSALRWSLAPAGDREIGLRLASALWLLWIYRHLDEGRAWLEQLLAAHSEHRETSSRQVRARALSKLGLLRLGCGDRSGAAEALEQSLQVFDGATAERIFALNTAAEVAIDQRHLDRAAALAEEATGLAARIKDPRELGYTLHARAGLALAQDNPHAAIPLAEQAVRIFRSLQDRAGLGLALTDLGNATADIGDYGQAAELLGEALRVRRAMGRPRTLATALNNLGWLAMRRGDQRQAQAFFEESLTLARPESDSAQIAITLEGFASLAFHNGKAGRAVSLYAAAAKLRQISGTPPRDSERRIISETLHKLSEQLGEQAFAEHRARGETFATQQEWAAYLNSSAGRPPSRHEQI
jgi:predicted ATPase